MLGKKALSIIGLLFLNSLTRAESAVKTVFTGYKAVETSCAVGLEGTFDHYVINGKSLYIVPETGEGDVDAICKITLNTGVNVIRLNEKETATYDLSAGSLITEDDESNEVDISKKIVVIRCDAESCELTAGVVKDSTGTYYNIKKDETTNDSVSVGTTGSCGENDAGKIETIDDEVVLCLANGKYVSMGESAEYLMEGETVAQPFTTDATNHNGVISVSLNYFIQNNKYKGEVYSEYDTNKLIDKKDNFCYGTILNKFLDCEGGNCAVTSNDYGTTAKIYLINGKIYQCQNTDCSTITGNANDGFQVFNMNCANDKTYAELVSNLDSLTDGDFESKNVNLYECSNGICEATGGFIKYGAKWAKCTSDQCDKYTALDSTETTGDACSGGNIGGLDGDNLKLCIDVDGYLQIAKNGNYYVSISSVIKKFTVNSSGTIVGENELDEGYYLLHGNALTDSEDSGNTLVECGESGCTAITTSTVGYYLNIPNNKLVYCKDATPGNCVIDRTVGFFKHAVTATTYIKCTTTDCEEFNESSLVACSSDTIGDLTTGAKLCLGMTEGETSEAIISASFANTASYYLVGDRDDSIFHSITSGAFGIVKITANSMTLDTAHNGLVYVGESNVITFETGTNPHTCESNGKCTAGANTSCVLSSGVGCTAGNYYIVSAANGNTLVSEVGTNGYLYKCESTENTAIPPSIECKSISDRGYIVVSQSEIYSCNGTVGQCHKVALGSTCSEAADIGTLYDNEGVSICLDYIEGDQGKAVSAKLTNGGTFIINKYASDTRNIFGLTTYGIVNVSATGVKLETDYESPVKYIYASSDTNAILVRGECPNGQTDLVVEYDCNKNDGKTTGTCTKKY